jgi:hypothetical protein
MWLSQRLTFTDFLHVYIDKCEPRIAIPAKIKHCTENGRVTTRVIPSDRSKPPPAFTCGSPDFKYYAAS